jgi:hypothetical protein
MLIEKFGAVVISLNLITKIRVKSDGKEFQYHLCQKVPFVLACFQASTAPRPKNSDSDFLALIHK